MSTARKLGLLATVGCLATGGLLAVGAPASATASLECDPATINRQNYAVCELFGAASPSNAKWTLDGSYLSYYDNQVDVRLACGATGTRYRVQVSFTAAGGSPASATAVGTCGGMPQ